MYIYLSVIYTTLSGIFGRVFTIVSTTSIDFNKRWFICAYSNTLLCIYTNMKWTKLVIIQTKYIADWKTPITLYWKICVINVASNFWNENKMTKRVPNKRNKNQSNIPIKKGHCWSANILTEFCHWNLFFGMSTA